MSKFVKALQGPNYSVIYIDSDGDKYLFSGGTWAWRNHNPGNLRPGKFSRKHGQIGSIIDQRGSYLAAFPDYEHGHEALEALLKTDSYQNLSLDAVIEKYAPSIENNTTQYQELVLKKVKVPGNIKLKDLSSEEFMGLVKAIEQEEGDRSGNIEKISEVQQIQRDKTGAISDYCCSSFAWLSKEEALKRAAQGKIDAVACIPKKGSPYLRAPSGSIPFCKLPTKKENHE